MKSAAMNIIGHIFLVNICTIFLAHVNVGPELLSHNKHLFV